MRALKRFLALGLVLSMTLVPTYAAETVTLIAPTSQNVEVNAEVASSFTVTIPKTIVLSSESTGSGTYTTDITVTVTGDIGKTEAVTVDTDDSIELVNSSSNTSESVDATVTKGNIA